MYATSYISSINQTKQFDPSSSDKHGLLLSDLTTQCVDNSNTAEELIDSIAKLLKT